MTCILKKTSGELARKMKTPALQGRTTVMKAREMMEIHDTDIIGVLCKNDFVGTFSRTDFKNSVLRQNLDPQSTILYEVMRIDPPFIHEDLTIEDACNAMLAHHWEFMPVLSGKNFLGIISLNDLSIIRDLINQYHHAAFEKDAALTYIHTGESYGMASYHSGKLKEA